MPASCFPTTIIPACDLILPDYTYVLQHADKLRGIVITHGHEDHTGSLPYLIKDLDRQVPIYGTKMTLGLIEGKFKEHRIKNAKLVEIKPDDKVNLGCITAEFFAVNHSIPGAVGVFFRSPAGNVLHTGDFKLDQTPIDGVHTDFGALARFAEEGVDLMMSDSTNATNPNIHAQRGGSGQGASSASVRAGKGPRHHRVVRQRISIACSRSAMPPWQTGARWSSPAAPWCRTPISLASWDI